MAAAIIRSPVRLRGPRPAATAAVTRLDVVGDERQDRPELFLLDDCRVVTDVGHDCGAVEEPAVRVGCGGEAAELRDLLAGPADE